MTYVRLLRVGPVCPHARTCPRPRLAEGKRVRRHAPEFLARMEDRQPNGDLHHPFWQRGGGDDRTVLEPATATEQIDSIPNNPVRRGLCVKPEDWCWSSAADDSNLRTGPL